MRTNRFLHSPLMRLALSLGSAACLCAALLLMPPEARLAGQDNPPNAAVSATAGAAANAPADDKSINIFALAVAGGVFMIPIAVMSFVAVIFAIERAFALRRARVVPRGLAAGLGEMTGWAGGVDPPKALRLCQQFPSAAANVMKAMLVRVGRPVAEIESAAAATSQREADKLYANVRWINLAASLSTMLGLIGTIQGMIVAFHQLTQLDVGADRTTMLAAGIYTALVTTFAGLAVAIPALFVSHVLEGRILRMFHQIDELTQNLLPQLARYEGRSPTHESTGNGDQRKIASPAAAHIA